MSPKETVRRVRTALVVIAASVLGASVLSSQQTHRIMGTAASYQPNCAATDEPCKAWAEFRVGHPYPYQSIQWKELPDGGIAIMLLEPPPAITKAELEKLVRSSFGTDLQSFKRYRWRIGIDGWLEDTVLTLASPGVAAVLDPLRDPLLRDRIAFLHLALFGTAYGATFDHQNDRLVAGPNMAAPNLRINPGEVRQWMRDSTIKWEPLNDGAGAGITWQSITSQHKTGAFVSSDRSLVLMTFPGEILKKAPADENALNPLRVPFRCFTMASDSIAGAFQSPNGHVAILGRFRTQSIAAVPPLRFETFKLLATQIADELSQSYERRSLFAGKMLSGEYFLRDWAPIYLSDALIDTEFGALLNTTDQLLKSWSEAGNIEYLHFNYPKPPNYPFNIPLSVRVEEDSGSDSVLFNWNTAGSAVMVNTVTGKALAVRQTGALPVTYGAGAKNDESAKLLVDEETAYQYFAARRDANLERVVQYTLLYQFFRSVNGSTDEKNAAKQNIVPRGQERAVRARRDAAAIRVRATIRLLADLQADRISMDPKVKAEFTAKLQRFRQQYPDLATDAQAASIVADRFSDESKKLTAARKARIAASIAELNRMVDQYNQNVSLVKLASSAATVAMMKARKGEIERKERAIGELERDNPIDDVRNILADVAAERREVEDVRRGFVESFNYEPAGSIKTPSIVISWDAAELAAVGGHNIDARTLKMEASPDVVSIAIEDTDTGPVLRFNPSKAALVEAHATELARAVEHRHVDSTADLEKIIATAVPVRSRPVALELPRVARTGNPPDSWSARLGAHLYESKSEYVDNLRTIAEKSACCEFVGYDDNGTAFATERNLKPPPTALTYELRDTISLSAHVQEAAKRGRPLIFLDTPEDHVEALSLQATAGNRNGMTLNQMAELLGKQRSGTQEARVDVIAAADLNGEVGFLRSLANRAEVGARSLLSRLTLHEPPTSWAQAEVRRLDANEVNGFVNAIKWNTETDGTPTAVMVRFGKANLNGPPIDVSVVAGFNDADLPAGRSAFYTIQKRNLDMAAAKSESLAQYALTVKSEMARLSPARAKRVTIVVQQGKTRQLLTMREWQDGIGQHAAKHAG